MAHPNPLKLKNGHVQGFESGDSADLSVGGLGFDASGVAKGGLLVGSGSGTMAIQTVSGNNGRVMTEDSTEPNGVVWRELPTPGGASSALLLYFANTASDISTYFKVADSPGTGGEADTSTSVASSDGEKLIKAFATISGYPNLTTLPAGLWKFDFYTYIDSVVGTSNIVFRVYKRILAGTETELFNVTSDQLTVTALGQGLQQTLSYTLATDTTLLATDRIIVKVYAKTTSALARTVHFVYDGSVHASNVQSPIPNESVDVVGTPTAGQFAIWADAATLQGHTLVSGDMPSGIDSVNIGGGTVNNTEFGYLDGVTSSIQTQINALSVPPCLNILIRRFC